MSIRGKNNLIQPILKWVGGKRQLISEIEKYIPKKYTTYYEPFMGGGAVFFHLQPKKAILNDINSELINVYNVLKNNIDELIENLEKHENTSEYFYKMRGKDREEEYKKLSNIEKASRIIYLNKTCYNGLFRVNSSGEFNTPFGDYKNPNIVNEYVLKAVNRYLNNIDVEFHNVDFFEILKNVKKGSFVYLDPPYDPISQTSSFTGYDKGGFSKKEQEKLKEACDELNRKGVKFLLSNSSTEFIRELYKDYKIETIKAKRSINSKSNLRGEIEEVLVRNYE